MFCRAHEILCRVHEIISRANEILCHAHDIIFQLSIGGSRGRLIGVTSPSPFNLKNVINQVKSRSKEKKKERNRSINYIHVGVLFLCLSPPPLFFPGSTPAVITRCALITLSREQMSIASTMIKRIC